MEFLKLFLTKEKPGPSLRAMEDMTVYKVETKTNAYCGRISHQNDIMMWLLCSTNKPVKILKQNIVRITII